MATGKETRPENTCGGCFHFEPAADDSSGRCRRYPPMVVNDSLEADTPEARFVSLWPMVTKNDWCGEFTPATGP
jgi:hypothetical protein